MKIVESKSGTVYICRLYERIDSMTSPILEDKLTKLIGFGERTILLDFANLDYISSAGLRVLLSSAKKLKANNGALKICSLKGMVKEVFTMSGFADIIPIYQNEEEALGNA